MTRTTSGLMGCTPDCTVDTVVNGYIATSVTQHAQGCPNQMSGYIPIDASAASTAYPASFGQQTFRVTVSGDTRTCRHCGAPDP